MQIPIAAKGMTDIPFAGIRKVFEKAARLENKRQRVIHFEIGRPDFDTPVHIKAMYISLQAFLNPGDEVLVPDPDYTQFYSCVKLLK